MKFKIGDTIIPIEAHRGFDDARVLGVYTEKSGKFKGQLMYLLKIMNGTASMPVGAEVLYKLKSKKP